MKLLSRRIDPALRKHWHQLLRFFQDDVLAELRAETLKPYLDCLGFARLLEWHAVLREGLLVLYDASAVGDCDAGRALRSNENRGCSDC